jgi:hypothetical protein
MASENAVISCSKNRGLLEMTGLDYQKNKGEGPKPALDTLPKLCWFFAASQREPLYEFWR